MEILIIRRDNIGDMLCVTPAIRALREAYYDIKISVFCNSYNKPVIENNNDLSCIYSYKKGKHATDKSFFRAIWGKIALILSLRRKNFDYIILASSAVKKRDYKLAKFIGSKKIIGYSDGSIVKRKHDILYFQPPTSSEKVKHEVEYVYDLFRVFEISKNIPKMQLTALNSKNKKKNSYIKTIGVNISARKVSQRWPLERFIELINDLSNKYKVLIFWSPGSSSEPTHPGDDESAKLIHERLTNTTNSILYQTSSLHELFEGISLCDLMVTPDGGAMHISAALNKPVVCLFGDSNLFQWHPWGVKFEAIQKESRNVRDIKFEEVRSSVQKLVNAYQKNSNIGS